MKPNNNSQTEDRIETVLGGLRHAQPAPGMEQRIAIALLREAEGAPNARSRWAWLRVPQIAGATTVVAAALLLSAHVYRQTAAAPAIGPVDPRLPTGSRAETAAGFSPLNPAPMHAGLQPRLVFAGPGAPSRTLRVSGLKAAAFSGKALHSTPSGKPEGAKQPVAQSEQGFPAPPLPLTEQERLLLRLVHRDDPVQLAQLAPAARERELERDREQVREFFKPPPIPPANFKLEPYPVLGGSE